MFKLMIIFLSINGGGADVIDAQEWDRGDVPARLEETGRRQCNILNGSAPSDMIVTYEVRGA